MCLVTQFTRKLRVVAHRNFSSQNVCALNTIPALYDAFEIVISRIVTFQKKNRIPGVIPIGKTCIKDAENAIFSEICFG